MEGWAAQGPRGDSCVGPSQQQKQAVQDQKYARQLPRQQRLEPVVGIRWFCLEECRPRAEQKEARIKVVNSEIPKAKVSYPKPSRGPECLVRRMWILKHSEEFVKLGNICFLLYASFPPTVSLPWNLPDV